MTKHNFTVLDNHKVNERIQNDLEKIKDTLLQEFPSIEALILVGGFGRAEGGVLIKDGQIQPINDYDIVVVTEEKVCLKKVDEIRKKLAEKIGIWWIDISVFNSKKIRSVNQSIYSYDLKYGSTVFWGNPEVVSLMPDMAASKMPLVEGQTLFVTRLWTFLGPFSVEFLNRELTDDESFFLANQMSKALLACVDVLLLSKHAYHVSYIERNKRIKKLYSNMRKWYPMLDWALEIKLKPTYDGYDQLVKRYFEIKTFYLEIMRSFLSNMYRRNFCDWLEFISIYKTNYRTLLKRTGYLLLRRSSRYEKKLDIDIAQLGLVVAYNRDSIDKEYFNLVQQYLSKATGEDQNNLSWEDARKLAVELRNSV